MGKYYYYEPMHAAGAEAAKHYYYYSHSPFVRSSGFCRKLFVLGLGVFAGVHLAKHYEIRRKFEGAPPPYYSLPAPAPTAVNAPPPPQESK